MMTTRSVRLDGRWCGVAAALWISAYFGARVALGGLSLPIPARVTVSLVPLPFFLLFLVSFIALLRHGDELERRIQLEALAVAFPLAMVLIMALGLIELAVPLNPKDWSYRHVWACFPILYFGGLALARRRYT